MKTLKLITLYAIVFGFGIVFGYLKNESWNIHDWGYYSSKYVSIWWVVMGFAVTLYGMVLAIVDDEKQRIKALK